MANFKYNPPTRTHCPACEELAASNVDPIIDNHSGKASSARNFDIHNWYYFVLGYSPEFPDFILERENLSENSLVVDPFMGTGTTLVSCKKKGIPSSGLDANDYFFDVAKVKTTWDVDLEVTERHLENIISDAEEEFSFYKSKNNDFNDVLNNNTNKYWEDYAESNRPDMLVPKYMCDIPFAKFHIIKEIVHKNVLNGNQLPLFNLALAAISVPVSNVRYGPGFGVRKGKGDVDVLSLFTEKIKRIISDLKSADSQNQVETVPLHGDARKISEYYEENSVDLMITSPPYPGDHEYTKHTRLELILMGYASNILEFRTIKKRMIRGSTTNIYKGDKDFEHVKDIKSIQDITAIIDQRLKDDGATSGFEKLYTKLVWEYFGGMYKTLEETHKVLKKGGKISLLVSDSHAFKMTHISTADILAEIGKKIGYEKSIIELWQSKISTSHKYYLRENIITLVK